MKYIFALLLLVLIGCATHEGNVVILRHYCVTNAVSATQSNLTTRYVLGTEDGVEITTIEGDKAVELK